jgi:hypothetical protein
VASPEGKESRGQLQKGYRAVPISETDKHSALRLCAVVREAPDPVAGAFVLLRDTLDASVYLGCLVDTGGYIHCWVELWIQNINGLQGTFESYREAVSNHSVDERWKKRAAFLARLDRSRKIEISSETVHPLPVYFDLALTGPANPKEPASSQPWELCLDDALLEEHGLPRYSTSLARYLYLRQTAKPPFLPVATGSPENESTQEPRQVLGPLVPLNPGGGFMMLRKFAPLSFESYVDLISGQPWKGLEEGTKVFKLAGVYRTLQNADAIQQGGGHLFLGKHGRAGRLIETFHLKLDLLLQAVRLVQTFVRDEQLPFLNLSADSFRVSLAESSQNLPFLWTGAVSLSVFGGAFALPIEKSDVRYFVAPGGDTASIYNPVTSNHTMSMTGAVRIRKVLSQDDGFVLEGTLSTQQRIALSPTDLLWLRLTLSPGRVDFYANVFEGLASGEQRFRTLPQKLPEHLGMALVSAEGVRFPHVLCGSLPMRSSPFDLHALATLGVRTLLVNNENTLPVALDEISSLAQSVAHLGEGVDFSKGVRELCASDARWRTSLGPHRLLNPQSLTPEEALAYLPAEVWWDAIGLLIQCFPGLIPASFCANFGDAPPLALHSVFDPVIEALEKLSLRTRSLLFVDWTYNAEVKSVAQAILKRHLTDLSYKAGN